MTTPALPVSARQREQLKTFLRHNEHPRYSDEVRSAIANVDTQIRCHDANIARLNAEIRALTNQRAAWVKQKHRLTTLLAPVRTLPDDVLRLIFHNYVGLTWDPPEQDNDPVRVNGGFIPALVLDHVCSYWSAVARDSPRVWSTIHLHFNHELVDDAQHHAAFLRDTVLPRSREQGLSIHIYNAPPSHCPIMGVLLPCLSRWERLFLNYLSPAFPDEFFKAMKGNLPRLRELLISGDDDRPTEVTVDAFATAPSLAVVTFIGLYLSEIPIPWGQLHYVKISGCEPPVFARGNCVGQSLKSFVFAPHDLVDILDWKHLWNSIQDLTVSTYIVPDIDRQPFGTLTFPVLRSLRLDGYYSDHFHAVISGFGDALARSGCNITILSITNMTFPIEDLLVFLAHLPSVEDFTLCADLDRRTVGLEGDDELPTEIVELLVALDASKTDTVLLPQLTAVSITLPNMLKLTIRRLVSAVISRWLPGATQEDDVACLRVASFRLLKGDFNENILQPLIHLRGGGLRLVLQDCRRFI